MTTEDMDFARHWLEDFVAKKAGVPSSKFTTIADAPIYELLDSLDLLEMLGAFEQQCGVTLDASCLKWEQQPSARHLVDSLVRHLRP